MDVHWNLLTVLPLVCLLGCGASKMPSNLTKEDIPSGLGAEVRQAVEETFSSDPSVRKTAALKLRRMGQRAVPAIPFLIRLLGDFESVDRDDLSERLPSTVASEVLLSMGEPVVEHLIAALEDEDPEVRWGVVYLLDDIKDPRAIEGLIAALKDESPEVRRWAVFGLSNRPDRRAVEPLIGVLDDKNTLVGRKAAWLLGKIGDRRAVEPLLKVFNDKGAKPKVRAAAADGLRYIGDVRAVESLLAALGDQDEDKEVRAQAAWALGAIQGPRAFEPLLAALEDDQRDVRIGAASGLAFCKDPRAIEPLIEVFKDKAEDNELRVSLCFSLVGTKHPRAIDCLIGVLEDQSRDPVQKWALDVLAMSDEPRAYLGAIAALKDTRPWVRNEAARIFAESKDFWSAGSLGVQDKDRARKLPALKDARIIEPLRELVNRKGEDSDTRSYARSALKKALAAQKEKDASVGSPDQKTKTAREDSP